jgi:tetratricopeptide (TPR) repeat protein
MTDAPLRLDGWKAIAAHLRRSRNTTMRWAQDHDFPVRRMPSKTGGSVWAYAHELDAWLAKEAPAKTVSAGEASETLDAGAQGASGSATGPGRRTIALAVLALAALVAITVAMVMLRGAAPPAGKSDTAPRDEAVAEIYLQARDDWAARSPEALRKAMSEFGAVISRDPGFAPAYTGLADVYVASGDYAGMPGEASFAKAESAARAALAIDPENADAYRLLGYMDYFVRHDIGSARENFRRSIRIQPNNAETHLWFGSTLCVAGDWDESLRELRIARQLDPGSKVTQMFYAWSSWLRGPGDPGLAELESLADEGAPNMTRLFLSEIFLSKGDVATYLDQSERFAGLLRDPNVMAYVAAEREAWRQGGEAGFLDLITRRPRSPGFNQLPAADDVSATLASLHGRRDRLLAILVHAAGAGEHWVDWRPDQDRFSRWRSDRAVMEALGRVTLRRDR